MLSPQRRRCIRVALCIPFLAFGVACGPVSGPAATTSPTATRASSPLPTPMPLTTDAVQTMVNEVFPTDGDGHVCPLADCPFTQRLRSQLEHLLSQTPDPTAHGDICEGSLISGIQAPPTVPVPTAITVKSSDTATAVIYQGSGEGRIAAVTFAVLNSAFGPLVDGIVYSTGKSVYDLSCTGTFGNQ